MIQYKGQKNKCVRTTSYDEQAYLKAVLESNGDDVPVSVLRRDHNEVEELFCPSTHFRKPDFLLGLLCSEYPCPSGVLCACQPCESTPPVLVRASRIQKKGGGGGEGGEKGRKTTTRAERHRNTRTHTHSHTHAHTYSYTHSLFLLPSLQTYRLNSWALNEDVLASQDDVSGESSARRCRRSHVCATATQLETQHFLIEDKLYDERSNRDEISYRVTVRSPLGDEFQGTTERDPNIPSLTKVNITSLQYGLHSIDVRHNRGTQTQTETQAHRRTRTHTHTHSRHTHAHTHTHTDTCSPSLHTALADCARRPVCA